MNCKFCKNCIHYEVCDYSTVMDKVVDCKQFISKTIVSDTVNKFADYLKENSFLCDPDNGFSFYAIDIDDLDGFVEEFWRETNDST